jgi:hypothetical protein
VPHGNASLVKSLTEGLEEPILVLYVLHTTRGEGPVGRYQAGELTREETCRFLDRFKPYFQADARFDLWLHFPNSHATIVWDRHNLLYLYGPIEHFKHVLTGLGFEPGEPNVNFHHVHYYRAEFDHDARELLGYFDWTWSQLRPEDL